MPQRSDNEYKVLAVDIGGTKILAGLFSLEGQVLAKETTPTLAEEGVTLVIKRLFSAIEAILRNNKIQISQLSGIALACAGGIDTGRGMVVTPSPHMPGWLNIPLADVIRSRFHCATYVLNDASAAALGEQRFGVGSSVDNIVLLTLGTGIGSGIIANGELYLGTDGAAGELGHMTIMDNGPTCRCGNKGCLEMFASGTAIAHDAINRIKQNEKSLLSGMVKGRVENITAKTVAKAARNGDVLAQQVIARAAYYLGVGAVNIANIFNPELLILGGGVAAFADMMIEKVNDLVKERAFSISSQSLRIVKAKLGNKAGIYGAAAYAGARIKKRA